MVTRFVSVLFAVLLFVVSASVASAKEPPRGSAEDYTFYHPRLAVGNEPIEVGVSVEVVATKSGKMALRVLNYEDHVFPLVRIEFLSPDRWRDAEVGDIGVVLSYRDFKNTDDEFVTDGVVDIITVQGDPQYTVEQKAVLEAARMFADEARAGNFVYLWYAADCTPSYYLVDGQSAVRGPYGNTIMVSPTGSEVSAVYEPGGWCMEGKTEPWVRWTHFVYPGDTIHGTERTFVDDIADVDPGAWCYYTVGFQTPQWQPETVPVGADKECPQLYSRTDNRANAVLARWGMSPSMDENVSQDYESYVWTGGEFGHEFDVPMPQLSWVAVREIRLSADTLYYLSTREGEPVLDKWGGARKHFTDVRFAVGQPIVFYPLSGLDEEFSWARAQVFQVVENADGSYSLQKAVLK